MFGIKIYDNQASGSHFADEEDSDHDDPHIDNSLGSKFPLSIVTYLQN